MSEERRGRSMMNPTELWRQWYETSARVWSGVLGAGQGNQADPYSLYRQWFDGLEDFQQQMFGAMSWPATASNGSLTASGGSPALANPATEPAAQNPAAALKPASDAAAGQAAEVQNLWKQWSEATQDSWQKALAAGQEAVELTPVGSRRSTKSGTTSSPPRVTRPTRCSSSRACTTPPTVPSPISSATS